MLLPHHEVAIVDESKIVDYLLNPDHPEGAGKSAFFLGCGFSVDEWDAMASALRATTAKNPVTRCVRTSHGEKFVVEGRLDTPVGRTPLVRSVWIIDRGMTIPRLVTAYPLDGE